MKKIYFLLASLLFSIALFPSQTTEGTEFWVTYMNNALIIDETAEDGLALELIVSSRNDATIIVENPRTGWKVTSSVSANTVRKIPVPSEQGYVYNPATIYDAGIRVTSTSPISLYASNYTKASYDATIVLPITGLGNEYIIQTFESAGLREFCVVATEDNTFLTIIPNAETYEGRERGVAYGGTLHKGQAYMVMSQDEYYELSGSLVKADKPIAVFAGHLCATVPNGRSWCDHLVEEQLPTNMWGKNFALTKTYGLAGDHVRVTALKDGTEIVINGTNIATIGALETYTFRLTENSSYLEASNPVACYSYIEGGDTPGNNEMSDPSSVLISPIEQRLQEITFATFQTDLSRDHYVNIVTSKLGAQYIKLDNVSITGEFSPLVGNNDLYYAQIPITHGTHTLKTNSEGFIGHVYGLGHCESYAYSIGSSTLDLSGNILIEGVIESDLDGSGRCYKKPITFSPQTIDSYDNIFWNFGDGNTSNQDVVTHTYSAPGTYEISMIIANKDGRDTAYAHLTLVDVLYDTIAVELCSGESFVVGGESFTYAKSGRYDITIPSVDGCDSIVTVDLTVKPINTVMLYDTICDGRTYIWDGDAYTETGIYTKKYTNQYGCDSTVTLNLTISAPYNHEFSAIIRSGEVYTWDGLQYTTTGSYTRKYTSIEGCDSIVTLHLTVGEVYAIDLYDTICAGETYTWNEYNYVNTGSYTQYFATQYGYDSIVTLHLTVGDLYNVEWIDTICAGETLTWNAEAYTKSGSYTQSLVSRYGCDSLVTLHLLVADLYDMSIYDTICAGEIYTWDGLQYTTTGVYPRKYQSNYGCDSVVTLNLTVAETYDIAFTDTICAGETYRWNSEKYTESGSYTQSFTTQYGCDSIVTLHLIVGDLYNVEWSDTICDGETLTWNAEAYTKSGSYTQSLVSRYGCDSLVTLHLLVADLYDMSIYDTICAGETYSWDGVKYTTTGVYPRKYQSRYGCDSLVTLYLTVGEKYDIEMFDTICENEVYVWNKVRYTESGSYTQEFTTVHGCDSIVTVHLFVAPIVYESYAEAICKDEPYYFGKNILTKPGVYVDTAVSMYGCDSITTLTLRVHEPYLIDQYIEACHNDTFMFRGMLIDEPGIYYDSMLTQHGCDSVYRLIYNKTPTYMFQEEDSICVGSTYNFRGMTLTKPGVYYDSLSTVSGCDSIYKLVLHNFSHSDVYSIEVADVCGDNQSLQLVAHYEGQRPEYYNIIYSKEANAQGFKNIIQVPFTTDTIEAPMPNATPYIHPDYYELTLQLGNYKCPKSVSEHTTDFLVRYPSWIIEQNWQDVVAVLNAQHNGGYTFENYEWYVNNQPASQNKSYLYLPTLRVGDEVELHVMRQGEDYYVPTCSIIIEEQDAYNQDHPTLATPAKVSRNNRQVSLEAQAASTQYCLYDIAGRCLLEGVCEYGQVQHFELPTVAGSYFLTMVDAENRKQTIHMVVD